MESNFKKVQTQFFNDKHKDQANLVWSTPKKNKLEFSSNFQNEQCEIV